ncbi:MAG: hypothetical protein LBG89_03800 [Rickettsiales bacterium]|jgi:hypothetical protein|nr:hypothetical protein [Rickettsiales bacterium]
MQDVEVKFIAFHKVPPRDDACEVRLNFDPDADYIDAPFGFQPTHGQLSRDACDEDGLTNERFLAAGDYSLARQCIVSWVALFETAQINEHWKSVIENEVRGKMENSVFEKTFRALYDKYMRQFAE